MGYQNRPRRDDVDLPRLAEAAKDANEALYILRSTFENEATAFEEAWDARSDEWKQHSAAARDFEVAMKELRRFANDLFELRNLEIPYYTGPKTEE